jgi:hypothetical protein
MLALGFGTVSAWAFCGVKTAANASAMHSGAMDLSDNRVFMVHLLLS